MLTQDREMVALGGAVKAEADGKLGGMLIRFGGKDKVGQFFSAKTDFWGSDTSKSVPLVWFHGVKALGPVRVGTATLTRTDDGISISALLDDEAPERERMLEAAKAGKLGWSSGSAWNLIKVADDGHIEQWPIIESSLAPIGKVKDSRNAVVALKAFAGEGDLPNPYTLGDLSNYLAAVKAGAVLSEPEKFRLQALLSALEGAARDVREVLSGATIRPAGVLDLGFADTDAKWIASRELDRMAAGGMKAGASSSAPPDDLTDDDLAEAQAALALTE